MRWERTQTVKNGSRCGIKGVLRFQKDGEGRMDPALDHEGGPFRVLVHKGLGSVSGGSGYGR